MNVRISRDRLILLSVVTGYIGVFNVCYRLLIVPVFEFWGLGYTTIPTLHLLAIIAMCLIPAAWMPLEFSRPSLLFFYVQYFLIFIPASFIVYYSSRPRLTPGDAFALVTTLFLGLSLIQLAYAFRPLAILAVRISADFFWLAFAFVTGLLLIYLAITLAGNFQVVSFSDVYGVRNAMNEALQATGSTFGAYAQTIVSAALLPMLFAVIVAKRAWWATSLVALGYLFLFGVGGAKSSALAILYLPASAILLSRRRDRIAMYFGGSLCAILLLGFLTRAWLPSSMHIAFEAVVHFRFFTVPPLTIPQYFEFFRDHPVTRLSHVTGFHQLLHYPYELDVPTAVGMAFYGAPVGANSGFWAGDGIAGFGLPGIVLMSVVCACFFWLLDSVTVGFDPTFAALALAFSCVFFQNVSLFTTLLTGGVGLLMLAFLVGPRDVDGALRPPRLTAIVSRVSE